MKEKKKLNHEGHEDSRRRDLVSNAIGTRIFEICDLRINRNNLTFKIQHLTFLKKGFIR